MLRAYPRHLAFGGSRQDPLELGQQWSKITQAIRRSLKYDHSNAEWGEVLLKREVSIRESCSFKRPASTRRRCQERRAYYD